MNIPSPVIQTPPELPEPNWELTAIPIEEMSRQKLEEHVHKLSSCLQLAHQHVYVGRSINEAANAQMVVQDMYCTKAKYALYTKENAKRRDKSVIFKDGKGVVFTSQDILDELRKHKEEKDKKEAEKRHRKSRREKKKAMREAIETEWKEMGEAHLRALEAWKLDCEHCKQAGLPRKHWPKKPKKGKKPRVPKNTDLDELDDEETESGSDSEDSDDGQ